MKLVTPELWYGLFWLAMGAGFLGALYFVIFYAVKHAIASGS